MQTVAERLQQAMDRAGISPARLSQRIEVSRTAVSLWLSGQTENLKMDNLFNAARELGCSAEWLATGRGSMDTRHHDQKIDRAIKKMEGFSESKKDQANKIFDAIAEPLEHGNESGRR